MEKINYGRMILGGVLATIVILLVGFVFQGLILESRYEYLQSIGVVLAQPREMGIIIHLVGHLVSGLAVSMI